MEIFANPGPCRKQMGAEGMALVETMIAAVVLAVGILSLASAISSTVIVDAITQENNLALDAAREVIEKVRSAPFSTLEGKIAQLSPVALALDYAPPEGPLDSQYYYYHEMLAQDPNYWNSLNVASSNITDWYGNSIPTDGSPNDYDPNDNLFKQSSTVIDHFGNFMVRSPKTGELSPWNGLPTTGRVRVAYAKDAGGSDLADVIEVIVTVRWEGQRGRSEKIVRQQVANWGI